MVTKKFIQDRIIKAQENISKKELLIQRMQIRIEKNIVKLQKTTDESKIFDITFSIDNAKESIESAQNALVELHQKLEGYQKQMQEIIEKENSRNIKVILDFLESWKEQVKEFYKEEFESDIKNVLIRPYLEKSSSGEFILNEIKLQKDLDIEANLKYDFIIERTNAIVGKITDASNLSIGQKGDLNGFIIGTKGVAKVKTIGAGGYNIQCFHFRTIINEMK